MVAAPTILLFMIAASNLAEVAALVGDPARANMLAALMDGRALTATELAFMARVTPQTASAHLAKLSDSHLLAVTKQGRHRYFRLASPLVGRMLEGIMAVAAIEAPQRHRPPSVKDAALRQARTCYDHLAGRLGVALADALTARGHVVLGDDGGTVTDSGTAFFQAIGIDLATSHKRQRCFCRPCLDWSERRPHLAGSLGAALADAAFAQGWIERLRDTRAVGITAAGREQMVRLFGPELSTVFFSTEN
ncbi:ArsR family transcriptional regulator [Aliidongia dinghuensis]|uniref:ArsR family transcriptional regulator n=1 Tax=Aliidongia dinghuensis TaxID=1867774 RepID=A0A8J3E681_9PROT|nr:helix-turn-helix transcriptional regulator [Aliidongia dinghuensis]GGF41624.1 ArsR family transcriptional regulator [Aliidongia dinghuensis]